MTSYTGPQARIFHDSVWKQLLKKEDIKTWYHDPVWPSWLSFTAPGGFARRDNVPGDSPGDVVVVRQSEWEATLRYHTALRNRAQPSAKDKGGFSLVLHEFAHCYVPHRYPGTMSIEGHLLTWEQCLERYSHPAKAMEALRHAQRRPYINAFSRVFRKDLKMPSEVYHDFMAWMDQRAADWRMGVLAASRTPSL